jgi:DNA polymerase I
MTELIVFIMSFTAHPHVTLSPGTFSILIAPHETELTTLEELLNRFRGKALYVCGNYPVMLSGLARFQDKFTVRRAMTAYQLLTILEEANESLILFEHDRTLFDDNADLIRPVGLMCRERAAETAAVILFSTRPDGILNKLESLCHRMVYIHHPDSQISRSHISSRKNSNQRILEGIF